MPSASLTPGELYINRDRDFRTGEWGPYIKIGIVRNERESKARASEHQTGNPREVVLLNTYNSPMVDRLETLIHNIYGTRRVSGEWFEMDQEFVQTVLIPHIDSIISEQELDVQNLMVMEDYSKLESNGSSKEATQEEVDLYENFSHLSRSKQILSAECEVIKGNLIKSMGEYGGIAGILELQQKRNEGSFNQSLFSEKHPEIYSEYILLHPEKIGNISGSLRMKGISPLSKIDNELDKNSKDSKNISKEVAFEQVLNDVAQRNENQKILHENYLSKRGELFLIDHKIYCIKADFAKRLGEHESLGELITWKRERKITTEKESFDLASFKLDHPELFEQFKAEAKKSVSLIINKMRPYPLS